MKSFIYKSFDHSRCIACSDKTTFCQTIGEESKKRLVSLLPKDEYSIFIPKRVAVNSLLRVLQF
ncbi:hypothetical protein COJ46_02575 [Bacillus sp. AFS077874]|nr:hypothetical protein CON00_14005 [Bacillus sp. AFS096315]PFM82711.1 hypothetical protein COJ46_02575 [Bacillus sp. AFS077874]